MVRATLKWHSNGTLVDSVETYDAAYNMAFALTCLDPFQDPRCQNTAEQTVCALEEAEWNRSHQDRDTGLTMNE